MKDNLTVVGKSNIHGQGLFAKVDIPEAVKIIEYTGERVTKEEAARRERLYLELSHTNPDIGSSYVFELPDENYDIDGFHSGDAKFINHSCNPNAEYIYEGENRIWVTSIKYISRGEEITMNYGIWIDDQDFDFRNYPCKCGSANCVGFMVRKEDLDKLEKIVNKSN